MVEANLALCPEIVNLGILEFFELFDSSSILPWGEIDLKVGWDRVNFSLDQSLKGGVVEDKFLPAYLGGR